MRWKPGDRVVFTKQKFSTSPGRRSRTVDASRRGEYYAYVVDKYWLVKTVLEDGQVLLHTAEFVDPDATELQLLALRSARGLSTEDIEDFLAAHDR